MSQLDDDVLVSLLRERGSGPVPISRLTAEGVLARGRAARRRATLGRAAATVAVLGVCTAGVLAALPRDAASAPPADDARPTTTAQVVEVAPGVRAVTHVTAMTFPDGTTAWQTGLRDPWPPGGDTIVLTGGPSGTQAPGTGADLALWAASAESLAGELVAVDALGDPTAGDASAVPFATTVEHPYTGQVVVLGGVPDDRAGSTTVTLTLAPGATVAGLDALAVPTFPAPGLTGWRAFVVAFDASVAAGVAPGFGLAVAGDPVAVVVDGCVEAGEPCPSSDPADADTRAMCAEFPVAPPTAGSTYEGWWSSTPAAADGSALTDPADWPPIMRDHPRTAVIDTRTLMVLETYDRYACGLVEGYTLPTDVAWPQDAVVVLDADTGEILETFSPPAFEPWPTPAP